MVVPVLPTKVSGRLESPNDPKLSDGEAVRCHEGLSSGVRRRSNLGVNKNNNPLMTLETLVDSTVAGNARSALSGGTSAESARVPQLRLGLDVHIASIVVVAQEGALPPMPARRMTRAQLLQFVGAKVADGVRVTCVQESCGFGFVLHRELETHGAKSDVITPVRLADSGRARKTDQLDARTALARLAQAATAAER